MGLNTSIIYTFNVECHLAVDRAVLLLTMLGQFCRRPMFCNDRVSRSRVQQESLITAGGWDAGAGSPLSVCNCDGSAAGTTDNWGWSCCAVLCTEHVSCELLLPMFFLQSPAHFCDSSSQQPGSGNSEAFLPHQPRHSTECAHLTSTYYYNRY